MEQALTTQNNLEVDINTLCEACGHQLEPLKCKLMCKRCGYFRSCSDLF